MTDEDKSVDDLIEEKPSEQEELADALQHDLEGMRETNDEEATDEEETTDDEQTEAAGEEEAGEEESPEAGEAVPAGGEGEEAAEPAEDVKPGEEPEAAPVEEEKDEFVDGLKPRARERWEKREGELKEAQGQLETIKDANSTLFGYLDDSKTDPEQLSTFLSIAKAVNTGNFEVARPAFDRMMKMMNEVGLGLGYQQAADLPPELQKAVDDLDLTPQYAQQIAAQQAQNAQREQYQQRDYQARQQQQMQQQGAQQASNAIRAWETEQKAQDPDFAAVQQQLLGGATALMQDLPPQQWLPALQREANTIKTTMQRMASQRQVAKAKAAAPIRPTVGGGGAQPQAETLEDHMAAQLQKMRGG